ncbi:WD40/YVTN/BNR-like repeat-containing protein [Flagellimonas sp. S174]|uniref:WD40/YVTN/BNR-like repeat-containing protein n=1 Tax=Flagellimonas sp. S174 TaxID=3410790 RepID=UPI003BF60968
MRYLGIFLAFLIVGCSGKREPKEFSSVIVKSVFEDSVSIRAIEFLDSKTLAFAGSGGMYGTLDVSSGKIRTATMEFEGNLPEFRAVAHTSSDFFMLSVANPALLFKTGEGGEMELVYKELGESVFYDAMTFWSDKEGIAIGDGMDGCMAIIITRDGGENWKKVACENLPKLEGDVGAYAASNTNIKTKGDKTWVITSKEQMLYSADKGQSWEVIPTPIQLIAPYHGLYSIDFYDENVGFAIGGDFSAPNVNTYNKIMTLNGGKDWELVADGVRPGYKSCVQYVLNSKGKGLVAVGFTGIDYSKNGGKNWNLLSDEGFYTVRFLNDSVAYAAGKNRIARLEFK